MPRNLSPCVEGCEPRVLLSDPGQGLTGSIQTKGPSDDTQPASSAGGGVINTTVTPNTTGPAATGGAAVVGAVVTVKY